MNKYYESLPHFSAIMAKQEPAMRMNCRTVAEYNVWKKNARNNSKPYFKRRNCLP